VPTSAFTSRPGGLFPRHKASIPGGVWLSRSSTATARWAQEELWFATVASHSRRPHRVPPSSFTGPSAPQTDPTKTEMQQASSQLSSNPRQASGQYELDNAASPLSMELPKDVYHVGDTQQGASSVGRRGSNGGAILFAADEYQPRLIGPCRGDKQTIVFERRKAPKA